MIPHSSAPHFILAPFMPTLHACSKSCTLVPDHTAVHVSRRRPRTPASVGGRQGRPSFLPIRSGVVALALEGIFGDQVVQRGTTHPQFRRRAGNVASVLGEGALNEVFLKSFAGLAEAFAWG